MSNAFLFKMPYGVPGDISRASMAKVEAQAIATGTPFPAYGLPGKISGGYFVPSILVGDTAPYGFLVRPYPTTGVNASDPLGTGVPATAAILGPVSILRSGYMTVNCQLGTPALNAGVYMRYQNPSGSQIVGGLEAGTTSNNVLLLNCAWMGVIDSAAAPGNAEIQFNI